MVPLLDSLANRCATWSVGTARGVARRLPGDDLVSVSSPIAALQMQRYRDSGTVEQMN
jgi:hypothetical protein